MGNLTINAVTPFLESVTKPQRYLGGEYNEIKKDWEEVSCRFLFGFPDVYEVGMSHLGLQILYEAVNREPALLMERAFSPWVDMEEIMVREGIPLYGLESGHPLRDYDCIGFTLQHEMCYTNVLNMLRLGGVPLYAADRGEDDLLVIAGGPCASNVEPLAPFLDAVVLGEGELLLPELLKLLGRHKQRHGGKINRPELYRELSGTRGVYVPALYELEYREDKLCRSAESAAEERSAGVGQLSAAEGQRAAGVGQSPAAAGQAGAADGLEEKRLGLSPLLTSIKPLDAAPARVKKARLKELEGAVFPEKPLVPYIEVVHDRMMLEVLRGCTRGCRFCQAGMIYRPVRERSAETLANQARALKANTGHNEISLTSLSSSDHTCIKELVETLVGEFKEDQISVSLPSLRANHFSVGLAEEIQKVRRTGFTFAPEAGSQRMRDIINKGVTEEALLNTISKAVSAGWTQIKLYFMIGLPGETLEDVAAIARLCEKVVRQGTQVLRERGGRGSLTVTASVSNFVPKAHTPFQWAGQATLAQLRERQQYLRQEIKDRRIRYTYHDAFTSALEAVFARGGRELAPVLVKALDRGCRFDSWSEHFRPLAWREAFEDMGWDLEAIAARPYALDAVLPWDHLDYGLRPGYLKEEYARAFEEKLTGDCRYHGCSGCGVCDQEGGLVLYGEAVDQ